MSLGDILGGSVDWLKRLGDSAQSIANPIKGGTEVAAQYAQQRAADPTKPINEAGMIAGAAFKPVGVAMEPLTYIPGFDSLMSALDVPRRGIDTLLISAQHADSAGARQGLDSRWGATDWGEFFNTTTWSRAWDAADYEKADRVTGGQLLAGAAFGATNSFDPFDTVEAQKLQSAANQTWYGRTMSTTVDLGESFVSLPGTGVLARGRAAAGLNTIADVERVAQRYQETGALGRTALQKVGDKARQYAVPSGAQNVDSLVARQVEGLRQFDGMRDEYQVFNQLKSRLETAPDGDVRNLANIFTEINKVSDPAIRERLRTNTFLAGLGSSTAKRALIEEAPLLAKNFENLTSNPREAGALTELYAARLEDGDLPINEIVDRVWNTAGDRAELAALKEEVAKRRTALSDHDRLVQELKALKPEPGSPEFADWKSMTGEAMKARAEARAAAQETESGIASLGDTIASKHGEIAAVRPYLDRSNSLISDILDVAGKDSTLALVGDAKPTLLNSLKANLRDQLGGEHYVTAGEGNTIIRLQSLPDRTARMALSPQARGSIALNEVGLGARQLADTMARSKAFAPDEIRKWRSDLIRVEGMERVGVVARVQEQMLERMAQRFYQERIPGITPEEALKHAKEVTGLTTKHWGQGNDWVAKAAGEQVKDGVVMVRDLEGGATAFDAPMLRSQMADSAPILDPWTFERTLKSHEKTLIGNVRNGLSTVANAHDMALSIWKVGALLRPGLAVRSMLDTGPRALASMSAAETMIAGMNGAANLVHNRGLKGLAKARVSGKSVDEVAAQMRYLGLKPTKIGGKEVRFAEDAAQLQSLLSATSKGQTVHGALFHDMTRAYDGLKLDRASWVRNKPDSSLWHVAYKEYADMLLASPTARKLAEMVTKASDDVDLAALRESIKDSPEFTAEYRKYAQPMGRTRSEFLQQLVHEVDLMFPEGRVLDAAKNGGLSRKYLEKAFPREARFEVPAPDMNALQAGEKFKAAKQAVDGAFRTLLDKPDMWLARNPVAVQVFNRRVQQEYRALQHVKGKDYQLSAREQKLIESKARGAAIGYVRNTFFDTTRYTGMHRAVARFSPFIAAWEDAMISWGRLVYDDPRRLTKLTAAYHAPYTIQTSQDIDLVVDENGQRIGRGADSDGVFIAVPLGALGRKTGVSEYRIRLDAINSIAQGDTWWLPGVGPSVSVAAAYSLGSGKIISREAALDIVDTDSTLGKAILKSVFLGGEVPTSSPGDLAQSTLPGWVRTTYTQAFGSGKIRTRQTSFNYYVAEALASGKQLNQSDYEKLWERADRSANAAAMVRVIASAGTGMTGNATVDGQFYADQLHVISAMQPAERGGLTPEEFFAKEFPEAADLDWSITKNETGIVASVNAAKAESRLQPLLKQPTNKQFGWMVLGRENMVETEFSRTAYAMQRTDGNRTYLSADEAQIESQAAVGWRQLNAWSQQISDQLVTAGADPSAVEDTKEYRAARKAIREYLVQTNPAFAKVTAEVSGSWDQNYNAARRFSSEGPLKNRADMVAFRTYDEARAEVMAQYGIASFSGKSAEYDQAREVMRQVGSQLAKQDLGFQQMWDRFLENEVE